jgi:hypothetical protein
MVQHPAQLGVVRWPSTREARRDGRVFAGFRRLPADTAAPNGGCPRMERD